MKSFNTKVGFVTNVATSGFAMLPDFAEGSPEYIETIKRLKRLRKEQGSTIDAAKGLIIKPFPMHWTKWKRITDEMTESEKDETDFHNRLVINKRAYFMRYVYSAYNRKYIEYNKKFDSDSCVKFNKRFSEILEDYKNNKNSISDEELEFVQKYFKYSPFIETDCLMNRVCRYMESEIKELKTDLHTHVTEEIILILKNHDIETDKVKLKKLYDLYKKYKSEKRNFSKIKDGEGNYKFRNIEQYNKCVRQEAYEISTNGSELANLAIDICYTIHPHDNKSFAWSVFGEDLIENIRCNSPNDYFIPLADKNGHINFLGNKYSMYKVHVDDYTYMEDVDI